MAGKLLILLIARFNSSLMLLRFFKYSLIGFMLIFGPVLNGTSLGSYGDIIFLLSGLIIGINLLTKRIRHVPKIQLYFFLLAIALIVYPLFTTIVIDAEHLTANSQIYMRPIRIAVTYFGCFFFIRSIYADTKISDNQRSTYVFRIIYYSIVVHAIIMCLQFVNPGFRESIYRYTVNQQEIGEFILKFRMGGLVGTGAATLSVFQAMGFLLYPFIEKQLRSKLVKAFHTVFQVLIFISIVLCGRSGLYAIVLFLPILALIRGGKLFTVVAKYFILYSVIAVVAYSILIAVMNFLGDDPIVGPISRSFDVITSSKESGGYQNETTDILKDMIQFPNDFITFVLGKPFYFVNASSTDRVLQSDIGYIVYLWAFGIIGLIIYHSFYFYLTISTYLKRKKNQYYQACLLITIVILFFQAKELFIYARVGFTIHMFLFFAAYFQERNSLKPSEISAN